MRRAGLLGLLLLGGCLGGSPAADQCAPVDEMPAIAPDAARGPTVLYLRREGATLTGGSDDSAHDRSSLVAKQGKDQVTIPAAGFDDATWASVVSCVADEFARFDVQITDQRPAAGNYVMAVFGGDGADLGYASEVEGVGPLDASGCRTIPNAVVMIFSAKLGADPLRHCEVAAHEIAHAFTVDHELLAGDPSSYQSFAGHRTFQDAEAPCGESTARACVCGRAAQSSTRVLYDRLGARRDPAPASSLAVSLQTWSTRRDGLSISAKVAGAGAPTSSSVSLTYQDAGGVVVATCGDGRLKCNREGASATFYLPDAHGTATFFATVVDALGHTARADGQLVVDATPAAAFPWAVDAQPDAAGALRLRVAAPADAADVTLYWTDAAGRTTARRLCAGGGAWTVGVTTAGAGLRTFVVSVTDASGQVAVSAPQSLDVE